MDAKLLLVKSITLLYKENLLKEKGDSSGDMIRNVIESVALPEGSIGVNNERDILRGLKSTAFEMSNQPPDHDFDLGILLQRLKVNCGYDERLYDTFEQSLSGEYTEAVLKRQIVNLRKAITNYFREKEIETILANASYQFKFKRESIQDPNVFIANVISQLEPLQMVSSAKDPAVMTSVDISDEDSVAGVFNEIKNMNDRRGIMRTGWQAMNVMMQGGMRRGETIILPAALQHKYKTGTTLSIFQDVPRFNTPYMLNNNRRPLILRISFEDELRNNLQFMYQRLRYEEIGEPVRMEEVNASDQELAAYIRKHTAVNGFHVKMKRIDPSQWTYKSICNQIIELEAEGFEIHLLILDYLSKVPTTGCTIGPMGTDVRDMFRRIRNFCSGRGITLGTPHQLSSDAKSMIRNGVPEDQFVKEINEKGYYEGSKQLDQEVDMEIYQHLFKMNRETWLAFQRGKHRIPTILPDEDKYFLLKFPKFGMPILPDINGEPIHFKTMPRGEKAMTASNNALFVM